MRATATCSACTGPSDRPTGCTGSAVPPRTPPALFGIQSRGGAGPWSWAGQAPAPRTSTQPGGTKAAGRLSPCHVPHVGWLRGTSRPLPLPRGLLCPRIWPAAAVGRGAWPSPDPAPRTAACWGHSTAAWHSGAASFPNVKTDNMLLWAGGEAPRGAEAGKAGVGVEGPPQEAQEEELASGGQGRVQPFVPARVASVSPSHQDYGAQGRGVSGGQSRLPAAQGGGDTQRVRGVGLWALPASRDWLQPHLVSGPFVPGVTLWAEGA